MKYEDVERAGALVEEHKLLRKVRHELDSLKRSEVDITVSRPAHHLLRKEPHEITVTALSLVNLLHANEGVIEHELHVMGVEFTPSEEPSDEG